MIDVTVPLSGEVFWIEHLVARQWERVEVYIQAFSSFSLVLIYRSHRLAEMLLKYIQADRACGSSAHVQG